ncbi:Uncharacterized protein ChrSV_4297 [Chromobacterium vaccinii]|nr:Uncharacterized protein ChrSW_4297 [Chromobacterium vaccinii]QND91754.1 Uncharacterized protein ChrSV_4297 [Chromobacterium vaccinii]
MSWKFWQKRAAQQETMEWPTDSFEAVKMLVSLFVGRDLPPFSFWRAEDVELTVETEQIAQSGSKGLVLALWFWQFAATHGDIAARMARDAFCLLLGNLRDEGRTGEHAEWLLTVIDDAKKGFEQLAEDKRTFEVAGEKVDLTFHWYLALALLIQDQDSPFYGKDNVGDADLNVGLCLAHAAEQAQCIWEPMLVHIGPFNPANFPSWKWSAKPGAFERHLQRRHNNPLFPYDRQQVSAVDVYYARVKDAQALADVRRGLSSIFEELRKGGLPIDWHPYLNGMREQLDELYEQLQRAGGDNELEQAWRQLREHIIKTWRAASGNTDALDRAEALVRQCHDEATQWTCQLSTPAKTIPSDEVVCSLLCESVEDIIKSVARLGPSSEMMADIRTEALRCVMHALAEGHEVPQHRQKLAALGVSI